MIFQSAETHIAINPYYPDYSEVPDWITQVQIVLSWFLVLDQEEEDRYIHLQWMEKSHRRMELAQCKKPQRLSTSVKWTTQIRYMTIPQRISTYRRGHMHSMSRSCWFSNPIIFLLTIWRQSAWAWLAFDQYSEHRDVKVFWPCLGTFL